ncbi:MAG: hypothetical protein QOF83_2983 [Solirubrobacteraceae bacterium]|jgi:hypothetical protein|nr:hypothetical protein [Solirubrobacteraceae bacterium]
MIRAVVVIIGTGLIGTVSLALAAPASTRSVAVGPSLRFGAQTTWAPPGRRPLSDARAASLVVHHRELRPGNARANAYVPSAAQLRAFHSARDQYGVVDQGVREFRYVTGRSGLRHPSTDDLIQWVAHKWGIPEDWIRAQLAQESWWRQNDLGDEATVSARWYRRYPKQARRSHNRVFSSMGISQVKWIPDGSEDPGSEPLRWKSTAFALDLYAAKVRFFYNGDCSWCGAGYSRGQAWNSIGGWYEPTPWNNSGQHWYITQVKGYLAGRVWARPGF